MDVEALLEAQKKRIEGLKNRLKHLCVAKGCHRSRMEGDGGSFNSVGPCLLLDFGLAAGGLPAARSYGSTREGRVAG